MEVKQNNEIKIKGAFPSLRKVEIKWRDTPSLPPSLPREGTARVEKR